jgi:hypothetical protein
MFVKYYGNKQMNSIIAVENQIPRVFSQTEIHEINKLKNFMSLAVDLPSWNSMREQAKKIYPERIISAVDGTRKWIVTYDKPNKTTNYLGLRIT